MNPTATFLSLFVSAVLVLAPAELSYGVETSPQCSEKGVSSAGTSGPALLRPGDLKAQFAEVPPGRFVEVPPGHKLLVVPAEVPQGPIVGPVPIPPSPDGRMVWVEAVFAELDRRATPDFEGIVGFKLSPPDGKAVLTAEEKEKVLAAIEEVEGEIVAAVSLLTIAGQEAQSEHVEEITFPQEFKYEGEKINPSNWEKRDVGAILNVTPTICEDGRIALILLPEVTTLSEWKKIDGTEVTQPIFATWNATTTVIIPDGSSFVLKEVRPLHGSAATNPQVEKPPQGQKTRLMVVSAKVVETK